RRSRSNRKPDVCTAPGSSWGLTTLSYFERDSRSSNRQTGDYGEVVRKGTVRVWSAHLPCGSEGKRTTARPGRAPGKRVRAPFPGSRGHSRDIRSGGFAAPRRVDKSEPPRPQFAPHYAI